MSARETVFRNIQRLEPDVFANLVLSHVNDESKGTTVQQYSLSNNEPSFLSISLADLPKPLDPAHRRKLEAQSIQGTTDEQRKALVWLKIGEMTTTDKVYATANTLASVFGILSADDPLLRVKYDFGKSGNSSVTVYRAVDADFRAGLNRVVGAMCRMTVDQLRSLNIGEGSDAPISFRRPTLARSTAWRREPRPSGARLKRPDCGRPREVVEALRRPTYFRGGYLSGVGRASLCEAENFETELPALAVAALGIGGD